MTRKRFQTTSWSLVLAARARGEVGSGEALAHLCEIYWYPLYHYVRCQGRNPEEALDLTQEFFLRLIERDYLAAVRPTAGKFRSFLLASLKHFLANERRNAAALKRGGGRLPVSLDAAKAEGRYRLEPADDNTPEKAYEKRWALAVLERARARLEEELDQAEQRSQYRTLARYIAGDDPQQPYREIAAQLGASEGAVRMAVSRLRRRFGAILREEIARTVDADWEVDAEVRYLLSIVR